MDPVRWYGYLVPAEITSDRKRVALLDFEIIGSQSLVICQQLEHRSFAHFKSYFHFGTYMWRYTKAEHHCFFELIFANAPQKVYFDLDIPIATPVTIPVVGMPLLHKPSSLETLPIVYTSAQATAAVLELVKLIQQVLPDVAPTDIMVFSSNSQQKNSYHVIVDRWCQADCTEIRAIHDVIMNLAGPILKAVTDHSMYKNHQQFRTYLSRKFGSERTKIVDPLNMWQPTVEPEDEPETFLQILGASLIANASYCKVLPSFKPPAPPRSIWTGEERHLSNDEIKAAIALCAAEAGTDVSHYPFRFEEVKGGLIVLKRLSPSFCRLCMRSHESENPYITIVGADRRVLFHCRRAETHFIVGSLGGPTPEYAPVVTPPPLPSSTSPTASARTDLTGLSLLNHMAQYNYAKPIQSSSARMETTKINFAKVASLFSIHH